MNINTNIKKANSFRLEQEKLRNKALLKGVNLIAPETIFLSKTQSLEKCYCRTLCSYWFKGENWKQCYNKIFSHIEGAKIVKTM